MTKKSDEKKVTKKTMENFDLILNAMQPNKWYKVTEFVDVVDVKESRIKMLLRQLAERGYVETTGTTKGKMYRKTTKRRLGSCKGVKFVTDGHDIDDYNDEIEHLFGVDD